MPKTARGVYHDLRESTYTLCNNGVVLFFSSELYRNKFLNEYETYRKNQLKKLYDILPHFHNYYKDKMFFYYDIELYRKIEKRGFRVKYKGSEYNWREIRKYALVETINTSIDDWLKTPGQK